VSEIEVWDEQLSAFGTHRTAALQSDFPARAAHRTNLDSGQRFYCIGTASLIEAGCDFVGQDSPNDTPVTSLSQRGR
jgi:hypothetical protein